MLSACIMVSAGAGMDASVAAEQRFTDEEHAFLLSRVQPALIGLIDGSLSTLAPIFAAAFAVAAVPPEAAEASSPS